MLNSYFTFIPIMPKSFFYKLIFRLDSVYYFSVFQAFSHEKCHPIQINDI